MKKYVIHLVHHYNYPYINEMGIWLDEEYLFNIWKTYYTYNVTYEFLHQFEGDFTKQQLIEIGREWYQSWNDPRKEIAINNLK